jgi:MFS transporter, putative metabolite:H+ symporter
MENQASLEIHERMDRLPVSWAIWRIVLVAALGAFLDSYEIFFTGYIAPKMVQSKLFTPESLGVISQLKFLAISGAGTFVFATFAGFWIGGILVVRLSDLKGRKAVFLLSIAWYGIATLILAFQTSGLMLDVWRFIAGIGIGVQLITLYGYLSEMVPPARRGQMFAVYQAVAYLAVPIMAVISWALVPIDVMGFAGWRCLILISVVLAVILWLMLRTLPESPRWLASHGRHAEAEEIVRALEAQAGASRFVRATAAANAPLEMHDDGHVSPGIFKGIYLRRTIMLSIFNAAQSIGFYGFASFIPSLLIARGVHFVNSLEYGFIIAVGYPFGPLVAACIADRFERKWQITICAAIMLVSMTIFANLSAPAGLVFFGLCFSLAGSAMASVFPTYEAELYPTSIRVGAMGFVWSWSRLTAAFSGLIIGYLLAANGSTAAAAFIASSMIVVMASIGILGPRTRARSLEELNPEPVAVRARHGGPHVVTSANRS